MDDAAEGSIRVDNIFPAIAVVQPGAIHEEFVFVAAGRQSDRGPE